MNSSEERNSKILGVFAFSFFLGLHYSVIIYTASIFLGAQIHIENIWVVYTIASLFVLVINTSISKILSKFNVNKLIFYGHILGILNLVFLFLSKTYLSVSINFICFLIIDAFLYLLSSIILEEYSKTAHTGSIRGKYNVVWSAASIIAPFFASFLITFFGSDSIFAASGTFVFLSLITHYTFVSPTKEIYLQKNNLRDNWKKIKKNPDIRNIIIAQIGLSVFYASVLLYIPFKILQVGIQLSQYLQIILPVALTPFIIIPAWLGGAEDKMKDEKEVLILGYFGVIISLILFAFVNSPSVLVWTLLLFFGRACACAVETSTNSYLFKKIIPTDTTIISIFQSSEFISYLIATPVFAILLFFTDLKTLFLSVSFFLCFVLVLVSKIHDTKNYEKHQSIQKEWKDIWKRSTTRSKRRTIV